MTQIKTALISLHDKTGLEPFARSLTDQGVEILSTGGTLAFLRDRGIPATSVSEYTGQEEILGGRVKTLHPKIFAGILARRNKPEDLETLADKGIKPIDLVAVSLYPFEETIAKPDVALEEAIEQIDIGGVSLLRAAAKNFENVYVVCSHEQFEIVAGFLGASPARSDKDLRDLRATLAWQAFGETAYYDSAIESYFDDLIGSDDEEVEESVFAETFTSGYEKIQDLRYGENPHQKAAFYRDNSTDETSVAVAKQLAGKELSFNNIVDLDSALETVRAFPELPTCCIIKHNNPCGVARGEDLLDAYKMARDCDPTSAFGGVIGFNREVDPATAQELALMFTEAIIAPSFSPAAVEILTAKKNLRLLETGPFTAAEPQHVLKAVTGGILLQDRDLGMVTREQLKVVSREQPTEEDLDGLLFAWRVAKFVKSNAIVYTSRNATIGIGAGQMSRIDSTNIAAVKAQRPVRGAYMASDAFFPFRDNVDRAADIGIRAIIQPGGSVRDEEVITAANEHHIILVFTGMRHFRH